MIEEFKNYANKYDMDNVDIKLKYDHSFRVMELSENLAQKLNLDEENVRLAKLIGLLHDYGRFEQLRIYNTYNDDKSIDHANYATKILFDNNEIRKFIDKTDYDHIIKVAINNHNKYVIEDGLNEQELVHSKIIRDADKIDILKIVTDLSEKKMKDTDESFSTKVIEQFNNKESINRKYVKNKNDLILSRIGFIHDIYYKDSIQYILDHKLIDKMYDNIENKEKFKKYFEDIKKYMFDFVKDDNNVGKKI